MTIEEPLQEALATAARSQSLAVAAIPKDLVEAEERILERLARVKGGPFAKLRVLYDLMDRLSRVIGRFVPCRNRCFHCCHYVVKISELEARYIERGAGRPVQLRREERNWHGAPCPFLKDGACSIYEHRPYVCRRHVALTATNYWCHPDRSNTVKMPLLGFSEADKAHFALRLESGMTDVADIREWFPPPK